MKEIDKFAQIEELEIDEIYRAINDHLDQRTGVLEGFAKHVAFKAALVMGWGGAIRAANSLKGASHQEINSAIMVAEGTFLNRLRTLGAHVEARSELSAAELAKKPQLFWSTHQGGGFEINVQAELMRRAGVEQFRYVMKHTNVELPCGVGETIASRAPILINRKKLKANRELEIADNAHEIVGAMADGENVLCYFEGTRSENGLIAHKKSRQEWGTDLNKAIEIAAKSYPRLDYGKVLVVVDTLSLLPEAVEEKPFGKVRMNGDCTITMVKADNLRFEVDENNRHDETTILGKARAVLKDRLRERVRRYREMERL